MKTNRLSALTVALVGIALSLAACGELAPEASSHQATSVAAPCSDHSISNCPICSPAVIETLGFCAEHGVPEAICTTCRKDLEAVYRAENDWCGGHGLPESQCEACNPGVLDKWKGMAEPVADPRPAGPCAEHEVENCPFCSPEVIDEMGFCNGHGVPEAVCTNCRNDLEEAFRSENDWCEEHGLPESHCESCNPGALEKFKSSQAAPVQRAEEAPIAIVRADTPRVRALPSLACATDSSIVRLASASVAERVGVLVETVRRGKLRKTLEAPATVEYDSRSHARLAPRAAGIVVEVRCDRGAKVAAGDVLIVLDSAALGAAKSALLQAAARVDLWSKNSQRERALLDKGLSTEKDTLAAETQLVESRIDLAAAEQRLANLGLTARQIEAVNEAGGVSSRLSITAPFAGIVVGLDAVLGEVATPDQSIISVADTSRMWVIVDVDQAQIRLVEREQPVLLNVEGWAGETFGGRVSWLSSAVDRHTRTVKVRAEFANPEGILRAQSFGTARIVTRDDDDAVLVPKAAVQWEGCCNVAFERQSATEFVPRKLRLGYDTGDSYEVLSGLSGGETVVTQGSFILKTELRKGSIGAGCCEVDYLNE